MRAPQVSVVLPTRNRSSMLMKALRSALDQEEVELEVLVVDEGSSDDTQARLNGVDDQRLTVLRHDSAQGVARARNAAIERALGAWIAFLDDDDLWAPANLRTQLDAANQRGLSLSYCGRIEIDEHGAVINTASPPDPNDLPRRLLTNNSIGGPTGVVVQAALLQHVGRFDERLSALADWDLWIRAARGGVVGGCPEPLVACRSHPQNMMVAEVDQIEADFELLREKYGKDARQAGIEFGANFLGRWTAARELASGRRLKAARGYLGVAAKDRSPRDVARALGALGGDLFRRLGRYAEARITPRPDWLDRYA